MLGSLFYSRRSQLLGSTTFAADKTVIAEILIAKALVLIVLFIFPPFMNEELLCIIVTLLVSLEFWMSKNLGRRFLHANWYVNTEGDEDQWVYEASLNTPTEVYEATFWYSFIFYGLILLVMGILTVVDHKLSLTCAILIGFIANWINFYAFSQIIEMRNEGVLEKLANEMYGEGGGENVKLPLTYVSKLGVINEKNSLEEHDISQ